MVISLRIKYCTNLSFFFSKYNFLFKIFKKNATDMEKTPQESALYDEMDEPIHSYDCFLHF